MDDHVLGKKAPEGGFTKNEGEKYSHWMDKELKGMEKMSRTEHSADERAFRDDRAGMQGKENPRCEIMERERGDARAPARAVQRPFEAEDFDMNQFDRGDERSPKEEY